MVPTALNISLFVIGIVSIFLYILFILTLRKFRKKEPFNSPFFAIFISSGFADILMLIVKYSSFSMPRWGWMPQSLVYSPPRFLYFRIGYFLSFYLQYSQYLGSVFMAWNRYDAIVHPTVYTVKWNKRFLKYLLLIQWLVSLFVPLSSLFFNVSANITSQEDGMVDPQYEYPAILVYVMGNAVFGLICVFVISLFYLISFHKMWRHQQQVQAKRRNTDRSRKYEVKLAVNGFVIFILMFLYVSFFWIVLFLRGIGKSYQFTMKSRVLFEVFGDLYCCINVYVMLGLNGRARRHFIAFLKCTDVVPDSLPLSSGRKTQKNRRAQIV